MKFTISTALFATILSAALPAQSAPNSVWNAESGPALPYRYIESAPVSRLTSQFENAGIYASESLYLRLYPSIETTPMAGEANNEASIASKTRDFAPILPRGILSSSYVQEYAYIDTYSNIRKYEEFFTFPNIRLNLAMPRFGNGSGGGYQPLQFGFGPSAFWFW